MLEPIKTRHKVQRERGNGRDGDSWDSWEDDPDRVVDAKFDPGVVEAMVERFHRFFSIVPPIKARNKAIKIERPRPTQSIGPETNDGQKLHPIKLRPMDRMDFIQRNNIG